MAQRARERGVCAIATLGWVFLAFGFLAARAPERRQAERAFEVASVAPNRSGTAQMVILTPPSGLVSATNVTVAMLLRYAYDIPEFRIVDAPAWVATEHFDVIARGHANATVPETRQMIRGLLADRFSVVVRTAQREMSMDVLTRAGASPGPQLRPSGAECLPEGTPLPVQPSDPTQCTLRVAFGQISGTGQRIADLVGALGRLTRRHVVDETALAGRYDFVLVYTPDAVALDTATRAEFPAVDPDGPALGTALQEQLGLRLRTTRGPVDVLVVERVLPPTPN